MAAWVISYSGLAMVGLLMPRVGLSWPRKCAWWSQPARSRCRRTRRSPDAGHTRRSCLPACTAPRSRASARFLLAMRDCQCSIVGGFAHGLADRGVLPVGGHGSAARPCDANCSQTETSSHQAHSRAGRCVIGIDSRISAGTGPTRKAQAVIDLCDHPVAAEHLRGGIRQFEGLVAQDGDRVWRTVVGWRCVDRWGQRRAMDRGHRSRLWWRRIWCLRFGGLTGGRGCGSAVSAASAPLSWPWLNVALADALLDVLDQVAEVYVRQSLAP